MMSITGRGQSTALYRRLIAGTLAMALAATLAGCHVRYPAGDGKGAYDGPVPELPDIEGPITGPGSMYIDPLEQNFETAKEDLGYVSEEFFVSGTAAGEPYKVRVMVTRPGEDAAVPFSGHAIVEAMHGTGIPFVWNFTREYLAARGHAAVEISIFPSTVTDHLQQGEGADHERYGDLHVAEDAADHQGEDEEAAGAADIYAQVGRLLKSEQTPLPGAEWLHMTGHSMAVGPVWHYMDTHHNKYRLEDGGPIYDGFFPETTRTASWKGPFPEVDVPTILANSELEVEAVIVGDGTDYRRPNSDKPGKQFRLYEFAGMPHNPSWMHPVLEAIGVVEQAEEVCENPQLNSFPYQPTISMALDHLLRWVEGDVSPPKAKPIALTGPVGAPGTEVKRDEHGNALGGVRSTTLDVPVATHTGVNSGGPLPAGDCLVYGSQFDFSPETLADLYKDQAHYVDQVDKRLDKLIAKGWYLEMFADELRTQAEEFDGFE